MAKGLTNQISLLTPERPCSEATVHWNLNPEHWPLLAGLSQIGLHVSAALAIGCLIWLTQQDLPALEKKVAQCLMFPVSLSKPWPSGHSS